MSDEIGKAGLTGTTVIYGIIALVGIAVAAIVGLSVQGNSNSTPMVTTIVGLIVPIIGVMLTLLRVEQVHKVVNSHATELAKIAERAIAVRDATIAAQTEKIADQHAKIGEQKRTLGGLGPREDDGG